MIDSTIAMGSLCVSRTIKVFILWRDKHRFFHPTVMACLGVFFSSVKVTILSCFHLQARHNASTISALMIAGTSSICQAMGINLTLDMLISTRLIGFTYVIGIKVRVG